MKRAALLVICVLLTLPFLVNAQTVCNYLPCGPLPWPLPVLPILKSPTPMPTVGITAIPTGAPTATGAPTSTPAPTGTIISDFSGLGDTIGTLQAQINATPIPLVISGTPVDTNGQLADIASNAGTFFGYVHGLSEANLGGLTPFLTFALISFVTVIGIKALGYILPVLVIIFGIILKIVQLAVQIIRG